MVWLDAVHNAEGRVTPSAPSGLRLAHVSDIHVGAHDDSAIEGMVADLHSAGVAATVVAEFPRGLIALALLVLAAMAGWRGLIRTGGARLWRPAGTGRRRWWPPSRPSITSPSPASRPALATTSPWTSALTATTWSVRWTPSSTAERGPTWARSVAGCS